MTADPSISQWVTPSGSLAINQGGAVTMVVSTTLRTEAAVSGSVQALAGLSQTPFFGPAGVQRSELGYTLTWGTPPGTRKSLAALAAEWRCDRPTHIAEAIAVALVVSRAIGELQHLAPHIYLISPPQVFLETESDGHQRWVVLPSPIDAVQFKDMVACAPETTLWLSGEDLVRRGGLDRTYVMAAMLYYALIGDLYPNDLSPMHRLQRQIAYRAGDGMTLRAVLEDAVPKNLAVSARRLGDFIIEALGPNFGRPMTAAQAYSTLKRLEGELSPSLLAGGWETTGRPDRALAILEAQARRVTRDEVPWQTLERLRRHGGRPDEHTNGHSARVETIPDTPIARIRAIAAKGPKATDVLAATLNDMLQPGASNLADDERLFIVYAAARWRRADDRVLSLLARPCRASWDSAVRALLLARLHSDQRAWAQVARDCRECLSVIDGMPGRGAERGAYASAFALMLDAGAHIGFVAAGHEPEYLEDAWKKLDRARAISGPLRAMSLDEAIGLQLSALRDRLIRVPRLGRLLAEVESVRMQFRIAADNDAPEVQLPWPEDRWLFA